MPLAPGSKLGSYEILGALGAGGMGEVYRARDPRLDREVAIKILPLGEAGGSESLRRFAQEARAAAALNHPNILAVFDTGSHGASPYIVSELLEGETLRARLNSGPLPVRRAVDYALQIARGLTAAHGHGIVHRDLKPENLLITRDGRVKILDFGLAKLTKAEFDSSGLSSEATVDSVTGRGTLLGTLDYMSPEQCRGGTIDLRSDLFSFGAVLYEMLSGRRAFHGATTADTISSILKEEPPALSGTEEGVPPLLERIVHHCLEKDPTDRFQSARDIVFALETFPAATSPAAPAMSSAARTLTKPGRSWSALLILGVLAVTTAAVALLFTRLHPRPTGPPSYRQLTFRREYISAARFAPDQRTVVYSSAHTGIHTEVFSLAPNSRFPVNLGLKDADVESISPSGEMLLIQKRRDLVRNVKLGVLARVPLSGAVPPPVDERCGRRRLGSQRSDRCGPLCGRNFPHRVSHRSCCLQGNVWVVD